VTRKIIFPGIKMCQTQLESLLLPKPPPWIEWTHEFPSISRFDKMQLKRWFKEGHTGDEIVAALAQQGPF